MTIYGIVRNGSLITYKIYNKLENAKKELEKIKKEYIRWKYEIKELNDEDIERDKDFKLGGFWYKRDFSNFYDSVFIIEIKVED